MFNDTISDYFEGVAAKYLRAVDANPNSSNQHEIGGLPSAGFLKHLGRPLGHQKIRFKARQIYISDESEAPEVSDGRVTWYDVRSYDPKREPEYRLYYYPNSVTELISEGDFFLIAKMRDGSLLMIFTPAGGTIESQLRLLFSLENVAERVKAGHVRDSEILLPLRLMLEDLGLALENPQSEDQDWLERILKEFGGAGFPTTSVFSEYARNSFLNNVDDIRDPDRALVGWMDHEEKLFRIYEKYLVQERLSKGFGLYGENVDEFISFSLSVHNRRKSRVGHAFEGHLDFIFKKRGLRFEQGRGKGRTTENNSKPDFIFPDFKSYKDLKYPEESLIMLGAKTTCKDRWRQVLSEADRIPFKHLITLEAAISESQTTEMISQRLQLVVPLSIQETYSISQRSRIIGLAEFIEIVEVSQR